MDILTACPVPEEQQTESSLSPETKIQHLEKMNQLYQNCLDALPGIVLLLNPEREIILANKAGQEAGAVPGEKCYAVMQARASKCPWCLTTESMAAVETQHFEYELDQTIRDFYWLPISSDLILHQIVERKIGSRGGAEIEKPEKPEGLRPLISNISHDFNNILAAIMGYVEKAQHCLDQPKALRQNLNHIMEHTERGKALIKHMLSMCGYIDQELGPIVLYTVVEEVLLDLEAHLPAHIALNKDVSTEPIQVVATANQIRIMLKNIIDNAVKAIGNNNGTLDIRLRPLELTVNETWPHPNLQPGNYLELIIKDSGHGIDIDTMEHIFEPYFTQMDPGGGYGLGLFIVRGIVKKYGGAIKVMSREGSGTEFTIWLPVATQGRPIKKKKVQPAPTGSESILYIDDDRDLASLGKYHLERLGYKVEAQTNAVEALHAFRKSPEKFHLVITDMNMPHMSGEMLSRGIMQIRPEIPIIMCTGFSEKIDEERARSIGLKEFILKPVKFDDLAKIIRNILDERRK